MEIRWSYDRLISTMGFPILVRWHLYIELGPRCLIYLLYGGACITYSDGQGSELSMWTGHCRKASGIIWWESWSRSWNRYSILTYSCKGKDKTAHNTKTPSTKIMNCSTFSIVAVIAVVIIQLHNLYVQLPTIRQPLAVARHLLMNCDRC